LGQRKNRDAGVATVSRPAQVFGASPTFQEDAMTNLVLVEQSEGVRALTLNGPDALNALTVPAVAALADRLEEAAADPVVRAAVVTGAGSAFSAGGDLAFLQDLPAMPPARIREVVYGTFQRVARAIRFMDKPVVAAVNGTAVGAGCENAVACDFRIASSLARFGEVWINLGCVPALGGMFLLPRIVGLAKATELVMTGEILDAAEALRIGLVDNIVMPHDLPRAAFALAQRLARDPAHALALAAAKTALNRGLDSTFLAELEATLEEQTACFAARDFAERVEALAAKRPPRFTGA
jgi:enoyl-CoA hydratase/carnithine racemase